MKTFMELNLESPGESFKKEPVLVNKNIIKFIQSNKKGCIVHFVDNSCIQVTDIYEHIQNKLKE